MRAYTSKRWQDKPPPGTQIDWGHPLTKGLVGLWPCNEGCGSAPADLVTGFRGAWSTSVPIWRARKNGTCVYCSGTSQGFRLKNWKYDLPGRSGASITAICGWNGSGDSAFETILYIDNGTNATSRIALGLAKTGPYFRAASRSANETAITQNSTYQPTAGLEQIVTIVFDLFAATNTWYVNAAYDSIATGLAYSQTTFADTTPVNASAGSLAPTSTSNDFGGDIFYLAVHNRALTREEVIALHCSPYILMAPVIRRSYYIQEQAETITMDKWYRETSLPRERTPEVVSY